MTYDCPISLQQYNHTAEEDQDTMGGTVPAGEDLVSMVACCPGSNRERQMNNQPLLGHKDGNTNIGFYLSGMAAHMRPPVWTHQSGPTSKNWEGLWNGIHHLYGYKAEIKGSGAACNLMPLEERLECPNHVLQSWIKYTGLTLEGLGHIYCY